ncbi:MAG: hypothetical protein JSU77_07895 [Fidelibacterota bacterium]|nr:MAG: hypothetical protein JSU77_07895 [Candidatus Neomarinimicrobiota bacterium]
MPPILAAAAQHSRYFLGRAIIPASPRLPAILLAACLTVPCTSVRAQEWIETSPISLTALSGGQGQVAAAYWDDGFYLLDDLNLEVLSIDANGQLRQRYGGWGTGVLSLDLPRDLAVAENSIFVLDQDRHQIVRLDSRLNPVATTPLPDDLLPDAFIRDVRQRFWVTFENHAGLHLYYDDGLLVDVVADEASGTAAVLHPSLLAESPTSVAVWDPIDAAICLFHLSGQLDRRLPLLPERPILAMVWANGFLMLTTGKELLQLNPTNGQVKSLPGTTGIIDLAYRPPGLYGLDQAGMLRAFQQVP